MFAATDTEFAPWYIADSNNKKRARLNIISHVLEQIPDESPAREPVVLPDREKPRGYREPDHPTATSQRSTEPHRHESGGGRRGAISGEPDAQHERAGLRRRGLA